MNGHCEMEARRCGEDEGGAGGEEEWVCVDELVYGHGCDTDVDVQHDVKLKRDRDLSQQINWIRTSRIDLAPSRQLLYCTWSCTVQYTFYTVQKFNLTLEKHDKPSLCKPQPPRLPTATAAG